MLTIQPNFTTKQYASKPLHFKGESDDITEDYINNKKTFYKEQISNAEKIIDDKNSPKKLKSTAKVIKVISEAILEGWAVLWGGLVASKFIKSGVIKAAGGAKTVQKGIKNIAKGIEKGADRLSETQAAKTINEKTGKVIDRLEKTTVGAYIAKGAKALGKSIATAGNYVEKGYNKIAEKFGGKTLEQTYDIVTKWIARTLGVGSGAAAAYNSATGANEEAKRGFEKAEAELKKAEAEEKFSDIEDIEDEDGE